MRYKGIILELDDSGALLINNEGKYLRIRRTPEMEIGIYVEFSQSDILKASAGKKSGLPKLYSRYLYVFGSLAAVIVIMVSAFMLMSRDMANSTFAYIDIDINPSIDLKVNSEGFIVEVEPLNKDAENIAKNVDYIGQKAEDAVWATVKKSAELGYLKNENKLVLVAAAINVKDKIPADEYRRLNNKLGDLVDSIESKVNAESKDIRLIAFNTSPGKMKQARENNMSIGRYSLYKNAGEDGIELAIDDARSLKISELINLLPSKDYTEFKEEEKKSAMEDTQFIKSDTDSLPKKDNYAIQEMPADNKRTDKSGHNTPLPHPTETDDLMPDKISNNTPAPEKDEDRNVGKENDEGKENDKYKEKNQGKSSNNNDSKPSQALGKTVSEPTVTPAVISSASPSTVTTVHPGHNGNNKGKSNDIQPTTVQTPVSVSPTPTQSSKPDKKPDVTPSEQESSTSKPVVTPPGQQKKNGGPDITPPGWQKKQSDSVAVPSDSQATDSNSKGKGKKKTDE